MTPSKFDQAPIYKLTCASGRRYVIYNAAEIGNPSDHVPDKWYFRPYPMPVAMEPGDPYESPDAAEAAALSWDQQFEAKSPTRLT